MQRISKATEYNWKKLNSDTQQKLTKRANKTRSKKRVVATSYLDYAPANQLLQVVSTIDASIESIMYSLCVACLSFHLPVFDGRGQKEPDWAVLYQQKCSGLYA